MWFAEGKPLYLLYNKNLYLGLMYTEKATYYSYDKERYPERKKELVRNGIIYLLVVLPIVLLIVFINDQHKHKLPEEAKHEALSMVIASVITIGALILAFSRQLSKYRQSYDSMELSVSDQDISFSQYMHRPRYFRAAEIARIEKHHNGEIHIINDRRERLVVCKYVKDYDHLLKQLEQFGEIKVYSQKPFHEKYQWPIGFVSLTLFAVFFVSQQPAIFLPALILFELFNLWSIVLLYNRYRYLRSTKTRIAFSLFMGLVFIAIGIFKMQATG